MIHKNKDIDSSRAFEAKLWEVDSYFLYIYFL